MSAHCPPQEQLERLLDDRPRLHVVENGHGSIVGNRK